MVWTPRVTVAVVVERDGRFLLVEEQDDGTQVFNQPAGHLEENEPLLEAAIRETREETGLDFQPAHLVGVYLWKHPDKGMTYLRFCFSGAVSEPQEKRRLDDEIIAVHWMKPEEIRRANTRSPLVIQCLNDYMAGKRFDLELLSAFSGRIIS